MEMKDILLQAFIKRHSLFERDETNCFRLFNTSGDGLKGLTVDRYGEYLLVQYFSNSVSSMSSAIIEALEIALRTSSLQIKGIVLKDRMRLRDGDSVQSKRESSVVFGETPPSVYTVCQNGVYAKVDLLKGQNTGIFLDMREVRKKLLSYYPLCDTMLNLFCYTALFSVHALTHGLSRAINVDVSKAVLRRAKENYMMNGLHIDERDFMYGDAIDWVKKLAKKKIRFSFAVIDPPTFSRNKRRSFSVKQHFTSMITLLAPLVPEGFILSSVNSHTVSYHEYISYHPPQWKLQFYSNESSDFVHDGRPYMKTGLWKIG